MSPFIIATLSFFTFSISVGITCRFLTWILTALPFSRRFSKKENLSLYTILSTRSWTQFILLLIGQLCIIQTNGHQPNCELIYAFIITQHLGKSIKEDIRAWAFNFWLIFLHRLLIWLLKFSLSSKITSNNFSWGQYSFH